MGIPILPVYGWFGAAGELPDFFAALVPMAVLAGAALAIANARADLERDQAAGTVSVATRLGLDGSWRLHAVLWLATAAVALGWLVFRGAEPLRTAGVVGAAGLIARARSLVARPRYGRPGTRLGVRGCRGRPGPARVAERRGSAEPIAPGPDARRAVAARSRPNALSQLVR